MPREFKKELVFSAIDEKPFDSVHYAVWTAADEYAGGDFYNFYRLPSTRFGILLGDVPETGDKGTLVSANVLFHMNQIIEDQIKAREETRTRVNPCRCMDAINQAILGDPSFDIGMYPISMSTFNMETGKMKVVSAGLPYPIIHDRRGPAKIEYCNAQLPAGIMENDYHYHRVMLEPGDSVFFFTDGVTEAGARKGGPIEMKHVIRWIEKTKGMPFDKAIIKVGNKIRQYALRHSETGELEDDMTICGFRYLKRA